MSTTEFDQFGHNNYDSDGIDTTGIGTFKNPDKDSNKVKGLLFSPFMTLIIFTFINFLAYFDRGALSSVLDTIETNLHLTGTQKGFLGSAFMVGYCVAAPIFGHIVQTGVESFLLFSVGLTIWIFAVVLCGISTSYFPLLLGRLLSGCGEAGFLIIAPPLIDKLAPAAQKGIWLSIFYTAIPSGYAIGFALPSRLLDVAPFADDTWRSIFIGEAIVMIPFVIFGLFNKSPFKFHKEKDDGSPTIIITEADMSPRPQEGYVPPTTNNDNLDLDDYNGQDMSRILPNEDSTVSLNSYPAHHNGDYSSSSDHDDELMPHQQDGFWGRWAMKNDLTKRIYVLCFNPLFITTVLGYSAQTFVTGGFAFYGISYAKAVFKVSSTKAGLVFGGVTLFSGIIGTLLGGIWLDHWRRSAGIPSATEDPDKIEKLMDANPRCQGMDSDERAAFKIALVSKLQDLHNPNVVKDRLQSVELATRLVIVATSIAIPFALACFLISNLALFAVLICVAEITLFSCLSVLNAAIIWSVPFPLSPQAIAFSVVIVHVLGDALSPLIIGVLIDVTNESYRTVMIVCCAPLALAVLCWSIGNGKIVNYLNSVKYYAYRDEPTFITEENTPTSYGKITDRDYEELQPFVRIRKKLLWPEAESCH